MRNLLIFAVLLLLSGCNPETKSRAKIQSLEHADQSRKYEIGLACMVYLTHHGDDLSYSKSLVRKLFDAGFFVETIYSVKFLLTKFPRDPDLFFLRGIAYRNLHQYVLASDDMRRAMELRPGDPSYSAGAASMRNEIKIWNEILELNQALPAAADSFAVLFTRAEKFFTMQQYDAVLFDLGSLSKMGSEKDSVFFAKQVSILYKDTQLPVEKLSGMLKYFAARKDKSIH